MVELPIWAYIVVGVVAVGGIAWGFISNIKNKNANNQKKDSQFKN